MNKLKIVFVFVFVLLPGIILLQQCTSSQKKPQPTFKEALLAINSFVPVPLPDPGIPGFHFPENINTVDGWITQNNSGEIDKHGWGLWTALTMDSKEKDPQGQSLLVYETWATPDLLLQYMRQRGANNAFGFKFQRRGRNPLEKPRQLENIKSSKLNFSIPPEDSDDDNILVTVNYNINAAEHIDSLNLLNKDTLNAMLSRNMTDISDFSAPSIALKPTYKVLIGNDYFKGLYKLKAWTGPPGKDDSYPESQWTGSVYIDTSNNGKGDGGVASSSESATPQTTYNINDFIHYKIDQATADSLNADSTFSGTAKAGDYAILVGMHVTSKETKRWTWQTFWWAPNPDNPPLPSSKDMADSRPSQLTGAARHYAMATAYTFIIPDQPLTGGTNVGTSIIGYSPYLEAPFGTGTVRQTAIVITNGITVRNLYGVNTNCMSCHAYANYPQPHHDDAYIGDTYVDMNNPFFKGRLKTDFLWGIPDNAASK